MILEFADEKGLLTDEARALLQRCADAAERTEGVGVPAAAFVSVVDDEEICQDGARSVAAVFAMDVDLVGRIGVNRLIESLWIGESPAKWYVDVSDTVIVEF